MVLTTLAKVVQEAVVGAPINQAAWEHRVKAPEVGMAATRQPAAVAGVLLIQANLEAVDSVVEEVKDDWFPSRTLLESMALAAAAGRTST
jgi:hypothetical protein